MKPILSTMMLFSILLAFATGSGACGSGDTDAGSVHKECMSQNKPEMEDSVAVEPVEDPELHFDSADEALAYMKESGHWEEYEKGILPQMAEDELDYATRLINNDHDGFVVVDKGRMKVIMFDKYGVEEAAFGMACAKNYGTKHKRSDLRTPEGFFSVKKIQNSTAWHYVDDDGVVSDKTGEYGPRFIRLNTPVTNSIGIHGTCAPWSIGGRRSHGCIRIANENIMKLVEMVDSGMPVIVTPGRRDMAVNKKEGYDIPSISTIPGKSHTVLKERREVARADVSLSQDTLSDVQAQVEERPLEAAL